MISIGSLFTGIAGLDVGICAALHEARIPFRVEWMVEIDPFCQKVLRSHFPDVELHTDVRNVSADNLRRVDVLIGGFACQDVSSAGAGRGLGEDTRSGLTWGNMLRLIRQLAPSAIVIENVASGARRWLGTVVRELRAAGYRLSAVPLRAVDVGAPHLRKRVFLIGVRGGDFGEKVRRLLRQAPGLVADAHDGGQARVGLRPRHDGHGTPSRTHAHRRRRARNRKGASGVADASHTGLEVEREQPARQELTAAQRGSATRRGKLRGIFCRCGWSFLGRGGDECARCGERAALSDAECDELREQSGRGGGPGGQEARVAGADGESLADAHGGSGDGLSDGEQARHLEAEPAGSGQRPRAAEGGGELGDAAQLRRLQGVRRADREPARGSEPGNAGASGPVSPDVGDAERARREGTDGQGGEGRSLVAVGSGDARGDGGATQSQVGLAAHGLPFAVAEHRFPASRGQAQYPWEEPRALSGSVKVVDRRPALHACGNAVVPQCALVVGRVLIHVAVVEEAA